LDGCSASLHRREARRQRGRRSSALLGLAVGAGVAALLLPQSGAETRRQLSAKLRRRKGDVEEAVDRVVREVAAGIAAVDLSGRVGASRNKGGMP